MRQIAGAIVLAAMILAVAAVVCSVIVSEYSANAKIGQACAEHGGNFGLTWNRKPYCEMPGNK